MTTNGYTASGISYIDDVRTYGPTASGNRLLSDNDYAADGSHILTLYGYTSGGLQFVDDVRTFGSTANGGQLLSDNDYASDGSHVLSTFVYPSANVQLTDGIWTYRANGTLAGYIDYDQGNSGNWQYRQYTYDQSGGLVSEFDRMDDGYTHLYAYDTQHRLDYDITYRPDGTTVLYYDYDQVPGSGNSWSLRQFDYDTAGHLSRDTTTYDNGTSHLTAYTASGLIDYEASYTSSHIITSMVDYNEGATTGWSTRTYTYDTQGRVDDEYDRYFDGRYIYYNYTAGALDNQDTYSATGHLDQRIDYDLTGQDWSTQTLTYWSGNTNLMTNTTTYDAGGYSTYRYDTLGQTDDATFINAAGYTTTFVNYDENNSQPWSSVQYSYYPASAIWQASTGYNDNGSRWVNWYDTAGRSDDHVVYGTDGLMDSWTHYNDSYQAVSLGVYNSGGLLDSLYSYNSGGHIVQFDDYYNGSFQSSSFYSNGSGDYLDDSFSSALVYDTDYSEYYV